MVVVYLDFLKAFVSVCHRLLLKKMIPIGIHLKIIRWVEEFLKKRTFRAELGGHLSSESIIKSGVSQGSVFAPVLFLIFRRDCGSGCNNRIGDLNTSKAKLGGAKYQREKTKTKLFFWLYCHFAKLLLSEMYTAYILRVSVSYMTTVG